MILKNSSLEEAIEHTRFSTRPIYDKDSKFHVHRNGEAVFWVPPFIEDGGSFYGKAFEKYKDSPIHTEMLQFMGWSPEDIAFYGYIIDGGDIIDRLVQCRTDNESLLHNIDKVLDLFGDRKVIEWDDVIVDMDDIKEFFKVADLMEDWMARWGRVDPDELPFDQKDQYVKEYAAAVDESAIQRQKEFIQFHGIKEEPSSGDFDRFIAIDDKMFFWDCTSYGSYGSSGPPFHGEVTKTLMDLRIIPEDSEFYASGYYDKTGIKYEPESLIWINDYPTDFHINLVKTLCPNARKIITALSGWVDENDPYIDLQEQGEHPSLFAKKKRGSFEKLSDPNIIATVARVDHKEWGGRNFNGTGLVRDYGYDPTTEQEIYVVDLNGREEYVPPESIRTFHIYSSFPGGPFDEIAFIMNGNESYVWSSDWNNEDLMPSHSEVAEVLLGIKGVGLYDVTTGVLKKGGILKLFVGDRDYSEENVMLMISILNGADVKRVEWNGETVALNFDNEMRFLPQDSETLASVREAVLSNAEKAMGFVGCFFCSLTVEQTGTLILSRYNKEDDSIDNLVPSCEGCDKER